MPIRAVTIDFWNTLYDSANGPPRNEARRTVLREAITTAGLACPDDRFEAAYAGLWEYFDHHWLERQRTPTSHEMVLEILRRLDLELPDEAVTSVAGEFSRGVLDHPPGLLPGALDGVKYLKEQSLHISLISDTAFSPGTILRELMERDGIARYFDTYIFSDETGVAKPHPEAFRLALAGSGAHPEEAFHIGDIERTDIRGARSAGMKAVLYKGDDQPHKYVEEATDADATMTHWSEIPAILQALM
jgi:putative hydrolase of the HAD superfamily